MGIKNNCSSLQSTSNYTIWIVCTYLESIFFLGLVLYKVKKSGFNSTSLTISLFSHPYIYIFIYIFYPPPFSNILFNIFFIFSIHHLNMDRVYLQPGSKKSSFNQLRDKQINIHMCIFLEE